ncbi:MAG: peptidylprolyl isomerase [Kiritimatiellae bacterium]|nr:peptidylprolyl isomerase [Kiritimatiellia bacterium]
MKLSIPRGLVVALIALTVCSARAEEAAPAAAPADVPGELSMPENLFEVPKPAPLPAPDTVIATINGTGLTQKTVNDYVTRAIRSSGQQIPPEHEANVRSQLNQQVTEDLITQMVLEQKAAEQNLQVTDEDVQKAIAAMPMPPDLTLDQALTMQGIDRAEFDRDIRRALLIDKLLRKPAESVKPPTEEAVAAFYEENKGRMTRPETVTASHILIRVEDGAEDSAKAEKRAQAEKIREELVAGADFAEAAKKYSEDPGSKDKGGEYTFPRGMMVKAFEDAAFSQELNAIGPLVETPFGFHIIKTTKRNEAGTVTLEEAHDRLKEMLERRDRSEAIRKFIEDLRKNAKIEYPGR